MLSTAVITILFATIFKVLPDAKIAWRVVRWGALFTALLFMLGRYLIGLYVETTTTVYGAAGSLIVILVWIYYTAAILYFGAEFTQAYANHFGVRIEPADYAVYVEQIERERDVAVIPTEQKNERRAAGIKWQDIPGSWPAAVYSRVRSESARSSYLVFKANV